jgi:hypothetical protein
LRQKKLRHLNTPHKLNMKAPFECNFFLFLHNNLNMEALLVPNNILDYISTLIMRQLEICTGIHP